MRKIEAVLIISLLALILLFQLASAELVDTAEQAIEKTQETTGKIAGFPEKAATSWQNFKSNTYSTLNPVSEFIISEPIPEKFDYNLMMRYGLIWIIFFSMVLFLNKILSVIKEIYTFKFGIIGTLISFGLGLSITIIIFHTKIIIFILDKLLAIQITELGNTLIVIGILIINIAIVFLSQYLAAYLRRKIRKYEQKKETEKIVEEKIEEKETKKKKGEAESEEDVEVGRKTLAEIGKIVKGEKEVLKEPQKFKEPQRFKKPQKFY